MWISSLAFINQSISVLPKGRSFTANSAFSILPSSQTSFSYLRKSIYHYVLYHHIFFYLELSSRLPFLLEHSSPGNSLLASGPANFFFSSLLVPALFFFLPLFLEQLHFLFYLSILHASSFTIPISQMPVVFAHSVIVSKSLYHTTPHSAQSTSLKFSLFRSYFPKGPQKMLLLPLKASFTSAILCFTCWQQFMLVLILHPKYLKLSNGQNIHSQMVGRKFICG